jgi:hypothetical protein
LWQINGCSNSNLDVVVLQHCQSGGGMNNFATEAASVIKGRITQEEQTKDMFSGNDTKHIHVTVTFHFHPSDRLLDSSYLDNVC